MESLPFCFFCFCPRDMTHTKTRHKYKSDRNLSEQNGKRSRLSICVYAVQTRGKTFRSNTQNWEGHRSIVTCSHHYLFKCVGTVFWSSMLMGDELGCATDIDRHCVFRAVYTSFHLDRERRLSELSWDFFLSKMPPKNDFFCLFSWGSRRDRVGISKCLDPHMHYGTTVSASNFQVLRYSGWRGWTLRTCRFFWLAQLVYLGSF